MSVSKPRGTRDFLPEETARRRKVESKFREVIQKWGFGEIITPTFEDLELFTLKSGEGVIGELYNFTDKGDREMTLRPELTAPVMRAYVNEMQSFTKPIRLFYFENCFRYERPQKGRYREFWQFGAELIGSNKPEADAEVIALAMTLISSVGIKGDLNIGNLSVLRTLLAEINKEFLLKNHLKYIINVINAVRADSFSIADFINESLTSSAFPIGEKFDNQRKSDIFNLLDPNRNFGTREVQDQNRLIWNSILQKIVDDFQGPKLSDEYLDDNFNLNANNMQNNSNFSSQQVSAIKSNINFVIEQLVQIFECESNGTKKQLHVSNEEYCIFIMNKILDNLTVSIQAQIMRFIDKKEYASLGDYLSNLYVPETLQKTINVIVSLSSNDGFSAVKSAREVVGDLPELDSFEKMLTLLAAYGVTDYTVNFGVARGLDYYTGVVFEIYADGLGAQKQICGGGAYKLISLFGGGDVVSVGFGLGFDRIMEICELPADETETVVLVTKPETVAKGIEIAGKLRPFVSVQTDIMGRNFKAQMEYANNIQASYVLIVGEKELESGLFSLKDMKSGEQISLNLDDLISKFKN